MLILALMMVLFANHMDERLIEGKLVIRCFAWRRKPEEQREPLVSNSQTGEESDGIRDVEPAYKNVSYLLL